MYQSLHAVSLASFIHSPPGFSDAGEYWRSDYEIDGFREAVEELWQKLRPLYQQLHAYVRSKLVEKYGEDVVPRSGPIPAHLLGESLYKCLCSVDPFRSSSCIQISRISIFIDNTDYNFMKCTTSICVVNI